MSQYAEYVDLVKVNVVKSRIKQHAGHMVVFSSDTDPGVDPGDVLVIRDEVLSNLVGIQDQLEPFIRKSWHKNVTTPPTGLTEFDIVCVVLSAPLDADVVKYISWQSAREETISNVWTLIQRAVKKGYFPSYISTRVSDKVTRPNRRNGRRRTRRINRSEQCDMPSEVLNAINELISITPRVEICVSGSSDDDESRAMNEYINSLNCDSSVPSSDAEDVEDTSKAQCIFVGEPSVHKKIVELLCSVSTTN